MSEVWVCLSLDAKSKVIATVQFGPRTQALAHALIHTLVQVSAQGLLVPTTRSAARVGHTRFDAR